MSQGQGFKITYATLGSSAEEVHVAFETAVADVRPTLGAAHPMWIDGRAQIAEEEFESRSPADRRLLIGSFQQAEPKHVAAAIEAGRRAFQEWRRTSWRDRLAALRRAADLLRYYCQQMEDADGFDRPMGRLAANEKTRDLLRPYGVWAVISPFNFPLALAAGMSAGALIAGNTVVFKPASEAAACGLKLAEILSAAGLPDGVFNCVTGAGSTIGRALVTDPGLAGLVFTGSKEVGRSIYRDFNRPAPRPCYLELGGKNPAIVTARADLDKAVEGVARAAFGFGGQKCSACSRVYVDRSVATRFRELLAERTGSLAVGDPAARDSFLGPVINDEAVRRFERCVADARRDGRLLCGGERLTAGALEHGYFVSPTLVDGLDTAHPLMREELFLPFLCLQETDSLDQAIELANRTEYGLTAGIFSEDRGEIETFFDRIEAGVAYANRQSGATTGAWPGVNPFCGWKASGSTGKGVCGPYYVQQFLREQSQTIME